MEPTSGDPPSRASGHDDEPRDDRGAVGPAQSEGNVPMLDSVGFPVGRPRLSFAEAREALDRGRLDECLAACKVGLEAGGETGREDWSGLYAKALAEVRRLASQSRGSGAARWLGLLVRHDPRAANSVHLGWESPTPEVPGRSGGGESSDRQVGRDGEVDEAAHSLDAQRSFLLTADEVGRVVCVVGDRASLGGLPCVPGIEVDPQDRPAILAAVPALRGGRSWRLERGAQDVFVDGAPLEVEGTTLRNGQSVALSAGGDGQPLVWRTALVEDCESLRLDFQRSFDDGGAKSMLVLVEGSAGRVRVGGRSRCLIRTPACPRGLDLWAEASGLRMRSGAPLELVHPECPGVRRRVSAGTGIELPWPLIEPVDVLVASEVEGGPPFWMRVAPLGGGDC